MKWTFLNFTVLCVFIKRRILTKLNKSWWIEKSNLEQRLDHSRRRLSCTDSRTFNMKFFLCLSTLEHVQLNFFPSGSTSRFNFDFSNHKLFFNFISNHSFDTQHKKLKHIQKYPFHCSFFHWLKRLTKVRTDVWFWQTWYTKKNGIFMQSYDWVLQKNNHDHK